MKRRNHPGPGQQPYGIMMWNWKKMEWVSLVKANWKTAAPVAGLQLPA